MTGKITIKKLEVPKRMRFSVGRDRFYAVKIGSQIVQTTGTKARAKKIAEEFRRELGR